MKTRTTTKIFDKVWEQTKLGGCCSPTPHFRLSVACLLIFPMALVFFAGGCGWLTGPTITIEWKSPQGGLVAKTPVQYENVIVGHVTSVESQLPRTVATVRLQKAQAHFVRAKSDFHFHVAATGHPAFIELIVLDKESPPAADGARFEASDASGETSLKWLTTDWKRTGILLGLILVVVLVTIHVVHLMLKLWAVLASLAVGAACAVYFGQLFGQQLTPLLPAGTRSDLIGYAAAFGVGILVASLVTGILLKPFHTNR